MLEIGDKEVRAKRWGDTCIVAIAVLSANAVDALEFVPEWVSDVRICARGTCFAVKGPSVEGHFGSSSLSAPSRFRAGIDAVGARHKRRRGFT